MTGHCACGAVSVTIAEKPEFIHDCNCSLCRKVGGAWGYFPESAVSTRGSTTTFSRRDRDPAGVDMHACAVCACTTHWEISEAFRKQNPTADRVGVNMRLFDPTALAGVEVRFPDGRAWSGSGPFHYRRASFTIDKDNPW